jgi:hypothetical protein
MKRANIFHLRLLTLFGYIGAADWTMWPLLSPGTFVQIDPKQTRVQKGPIQRETGHSQFAPHLLFGYSNGVRLRVVRN